MRLEEDMVRARRAGSELEGEDVVALERRRVQVGGRQLLRHSVPQICTNYEIATKIIHHIGLLFVYIIHRAVAKSDSDSKSQF